MIKKKTVFILGAGASIPYGFPSGQLLKDMICKNFGEIIPSYITEMRLDNKLHDFTDKLSYSPLTSVDSFLENQTDFIEVGKVCIAAELLAAEQNSRLFKYWEDKRAAAWKSKSFGLGRGDNEKDNCWYLELFNLLNTSLNDFGQNNVIFITFNYDRSLEQYLYLSLQNTYNATDEECRNILNGKIIHVYGHLGLLPWQIIHGETIRTVRYNPQINATNISIAAENINIIRSGDTDLSQFDLAFEHLQNAENICIIGFGYNEVNVDRLKLRELKSTGRLYGTMYGVGQMELKILHSIPAITSILSSQERSENKKFLGRPRYPNHFTNETAYQFIRNTFPVD
jgi:hypothetical protein